MPPHFTGAAACFVHGIRVFKADKDFAVESDGREKPPPYSATTHSGSFLFEKDALKILPTREYAAPE